MRSDNGGEYLSHDLKSFLNMAGIVHQTTCLGILEQNGVAERKNKYLLEIARALMFTMNVLRSF